MATGSLGLWSLSGQTGGGRTQLPSGTRTETGAGTEVARSKGTTTTQTAQSTVGQNTPQFALDALEQLVTQLMDRPAISDAELDRIAPMPILGNYANYGRFGFTGYDFTRYNRDLAVANARRAKIQQESGIIPGGTAEMRAGQEARGGEIQDIRKQQAGFTKEAAFADAQSQTGRFARQLMEQLLPQITRAAEGSGTSGGAVAGLLAQDAATRVAEAQAALGLQTSVQYGQLYNQLAQTLGKLTEGQNPALEALLQALGISKGTIQSQSTLGSQTVTEDKILTAEKQKDEQIVQTGRLPGDTYNFGNVAPLAQGAPNTRPVNTTATLSTEELDKLIGTALRGGGRSRLEAFSFG